MANRHKRSHLLGHTDVKAKMIDTHVLGLGASGVRSPPDALEEKPTPREDQASRHDA